MNKIYNTQSQIATDFSNFLLKVFPNIRKTQLNFIPFVIFGMIVSESSVSSDIANSLKDDFSLVQRDSITKRIKRLFTNKFFNPYSFYEDIIRFTISSYKKKHSDNRVHIVFDHMLSHENFVVFMISMRLGKQCIPLWFRCFDKSNFALAFKESLFIEGINFVSSLFDSSFNLIFLADRWFNSTSLMAHISSLGHSFCFRLKRNFKVLLYDKFERHNLWKFIDELNPYQHHSYFLHNVKLTDNRYPVNIAISKKSGYSDPWVIVTNAEPNRAIKDYGYRFGAIETLFKNQKSNGFRIESISRCSLKYFQSLYSFVCLSSLFLSIFGACYSKNSRSYKHIKLITHKIINGSRKRVMSLFNVGLTLFHLAFNSCVYIKIPYNFILYDI